MENRAFRKFELSVWKLLDCRILHQIPKGFWEPLAAAKPPDEPPLKISAYEPVNVYIYIRYDIKVMIFVRIYKESLIYPIQSRIIFVYLM